MKHKIEYTKKGYSYVKCTSEDCYRWVEWQYATIVVKKCILMCI
jgi:hypothetical protein